MIIRPGDLLVIQVWPDETLSGEFPVEESGIVYVPVLGAVEVGGLPLREVRRRLREGYEETMRMPIVTIRIYKSFGLRPGLALVI